MLYESDLSCIGCLVILHFSVIRFSGVMREFLRRSDSRSLSEPFVDQLVNCETKFSAGNDAMITGASGSFEMPKTTVVRGLVLIKQLLPATTPGPRVIKLRQLLMHLRTGLAATGHNQVSRLGRKQNKILTFD